MGSVGLATGAAFGLRGLAGEGSSRFGGFGTVNGEAARHAEMNHQSIGTVGLGQKVFRPALQSRNPLTRKALGKIGRERHAKIGPVDRDFGKAPAPRAPGPGQGERFRLRVAQA